MPFSSLPPARLEPLAESLTADYGVKRRDDLTLLTVRHPEKPLLDALAKDREILVERHNRDTARRLFRSAQCPETWHIPS
ncbi:hypothetical protein [Halomonas sp. LBP4]|uniref:hypothetical protein n=1 Tax=Halomonas sp. LBP4 TaxID=2044917 RepID=UPI000D75E60E|nr:hypothetical protein [Halomonas sp. LBP4]PXX94854.1 hypothetical protein CR157_20870 [Halomonas sp. LBP4]